MATRRDVLRGGAGLTALALAGATGGCEAIFDKIASRPVRRDISTLDPNGVVVQTYKDAVASMKALPASDPRNWTRQAEIHLNFCPHGNWYFLPWHRAYLFYFENICRELTGNDEFALPYWHWQKDRSIPAVFWGGTSNPLFHSPRVAGETSEALAEFVGDEVMEEILDEPNFELFASLASTAPRGGPGGGYGRLEQTPHNYIHGFVGGTMGTFMSPLDAVFWCHHNMIDCLWVEWNIKRQNPNTNDAQWTDFEFTNDFVDENGNPAPITVLATILMPILSYRFDDPQKGEALVASADVESAELRRFLEEGAPVRLDVRRRLQMARGFDVAVDRPISQTIRMEDVAAVLGPEPENRLLLAVRGVESPADEDFFVRVFVGKPDATASTPISDPHYAGSFAFFGDPRAMPMQFDHVVDLTETVRRLNRMGEIPPGGELDVQLVAVPFPGREPRERSFSVQGMELLLTPVQIEPR